MKSPRQLYLLLLILAAAVSAEYHDVSAFGFPCSASDPNVNRCLTIAANRLATDYKYNYPRLRNGQEAPVMIDEIGIELGGRDDDEEAGYRATFRDIAARGLSNLTLTAVNADLNRLRFRLNFWIPKIWARAKYRSAGTLLMVKASGGGDYWGEYDGVRAAVVFAAERETRDDGREYLRVRDLDMDFHVANIQMGIENLQNSNPVIAAAMNLFINANAKELLAEMKPPLRRRLAALMRRFIEAQFADVPFEQWVAP